MIIGREALFRNPTIEAATAYCRGCGFPDPQHELEPLAVIHRMRLLWIDATDAMLAESAAFLRDNGFAARFRGPQALTPVARDMRRLMAGRLPLSGPGARQAQSSP